MAQDNEELIKFTSHYIHQYVEGSTKVRMSELKKAINAIKVASMLKANIFVGGNGGSAAISNHLCCDFIKGADLRTFSLSCNTPLITAISNDLSYNDTLSYQIEKLHHSSSDIVILISSSGNSPNIISAAQTSQKLAIKVIGLSGFDGGKLKEMSDISLHVPIHNYGIVEDCHQSLMHIISQYIAKGGN